MEQHNKICPACKTENEPDYLFCKNCGTPLDSPYKEGAANAQYTPPPGYGAQNMGGYPFGMTPVDYAAVEPQLDGADTRKVEAFVGTQKLNTFMRLFIAMKRTGRKIFFNLPVALLGLFMVPLSSAWFFFRKMYKVGLIVCAASLLITAATTAVNFHHDRQNALALQKEIQSVSTSELSTYTPKGNYGQSESEITVKYISRSVSFAGVIFLSMFGYYFYYKHCTKSVRRIENENPSADLYSFSLAGGTNIVAAILIPLLVYVLTSLIVMAPYYELFLTETEPARLMYIILRVG